MQQEIQNKGGFRTSVKVKNKPKKPTTINNKTLVQKNNHVKEVKTSQKNSPSEKKVSIESTSVSEPDSPSKHMPKNYVLFIGNLPYNVTQEQLEDHFRKTGGVKKIRIPKKKGEEKTRGFAYIEFKDRISHNIALRLHQTTLAGRKINVEFTSIGGGKSLDRKDKLKMKNLSRAKMKMPLRDS
ncbi:hypothetical protein FSP39_014159 [Pinctada imbricata]|uniref:RRM domain-containing protein n=1 Tax=Pinctada imbricata TaxID=66713 RepID=A0AA88YII0_PINIB|nr:hypothetical protein FSP39_014159 [Pinctada imbricata]